MAGLQIRKKKGNLPILTMGFAVSIIFSYARIWIFSILNAELNDMPAVYKFHQATPEFLHFLTRRDITFAKWAASLFFLVLFWMLTSITLRSAFATVNLSHPIHSLYVFLLAVCTGSYMLNWAFPSLPVFYTTAVLFLHILHSPLPLIALVLLTPKLRQEIRT